MQISFLLLELLYFNNNLNINKGKNITLDEVMMKLDQFDLLCNPKFIHRTEEDNKSLHIVNNKYEWNFCKYLYVENYNAYTNSKKDRREIKEVCHKISKKFFHYFSNLNRN